VSPVYWTQIQ